MNLAGRRPVVPPARDVRPLEASREDLRWTIRSEANESW